MTVTASPAVSAAPPQWLRAVRFLMRSQLATFAGFWLTIVVAAVVGTAVVVAVGEVTISHVQFARYGALWFPFSIMAITATAYLPLHVASGLTRRSFARATVTVSVLMGVAHGVLLTAGLVVERRVYAAQGWPLVAETDSNPFAGVGLPTLLVTLCMVSIAGHLGGLLTTLVYYRWGWVVGTLCLPLTLAPIFLVGAGGLPTGQWSPVRPDLSLPGATAVALAVLAAAALAVHFLTRRIPIRRVES
ncbi:hypothetical protein [Intrasporangium sp.]|uniref:hypothetical protein n=1 Tax=Intrasporangium sp. TaxID=1925024 RepID=UPI00293A4977|nr:hypothetical protein [Intrasporangium sp.]MDV3222032.1 hypothetical protein [Intrasporangium sp.]